VTEVIVLAQISGQVERVQGVSVSVVFAAYVESIVPELLSSAGKQTFASSYIQTVCIAGCMGFDANCCCPSRYTALSHSRFSV